MRMKVADMHCDTISELYLALERGERTGILENGLCVDLKKMKAGDYGIQNFALFVHMGETDRPFEYAMKLADLFFTELEHYQDQIGIVRSYRDIEENWRAGKMSAMLTLEEGGICQGQLAYLRDFYRLGARMMTLTWNFPNELGYPHIQVESDPGTYRMEADMERGLTRTGIEFVEEMERLGMIIDLSHLNDAGIWDVFSHTKGPVVASHSNARAVASHPRNMTDEMIRTLAERGGVMGINYCPVFLRDWKEGEQASSRVEDMIAHIKHIRRVGGIGCIGLGSDFDGISGELEMKTAAQLPVLESAMRRHGFTETEIEAVFYRNVLRVYKEILK